MTTTYKDIPNDINQSYDVVIAGGGIVGCSIALAIAKKITKNESNNSNFKILLVEAVQKTNEYNQEKIKKTVNDFDPRVVALSEQSKKFFEEIGVWDSILPLDICSYESMYVWDAEGTGSIHFSSADLSPDVLGNTLESSLGYIVEQDVILSALYIELKKYSCIDLLDETQVSAFHTLDDSNNNSLIKVELNKTQTVDSRLLIAADGPRSEVRDMARIKVREWSYHHSAIVCTVETEKAHQDCAWQCFTSSGPLAFLPLKPGKVTGFNESHNEKPKESHFVSIVWSIDFDKAKYFLGLNDEAFCKVLAKAFEYRLGDVISCSQRYSFPLSQRHAISYIQSNLALVGDAAHVIHPLAGQGVNLGLADVDILSNEILRAVERKIKLNDYSILKRYERKRQTHNLAAMASMEIIKRSFEADQLPLRFLRNRVLSFCDRQAWLKQIFMKVAAGRL